jgi:hypothetical protein
LVLFEAIAKRQDAGYLHGVATLLAKGCCFLA